jgi:hypothetical protein
MVGLSIDLMRMILTVEEERPADGSRRVHARIEICSLSDEGLT